MSCFVMNPESIAAISAFTADLLNTGFNGYGFEAPRELEYALAGCRDPYCFFDPQKIYKELYALNVAAYNGRYKRDSATQAPDIKTEDYRIHCSNCSGPRQTVAWNYQISKLLKCYNYQVLEDATAKHPLKLAMRKLDHALDEFIVTHSLQYKQAPPWGQLYPDPQEEIRCGTTSPIQDPQVEIEAEELEP